VAKHEIEVGALLWSAVERAAIRETALVGSELTPTSFIKRAIDRELQFQQIEIPPNEAPDWADQFKLGGAMLSGAQDDAPGAWAGAHRSVPSEGPRPPATVRLMDTNAWVRRAVEKELERAGIKVGGEGRRQEN
jgi:hypothetical protein